MIKNIVIGVMAIVIAYFVLSGGDISGVQKLISQAQNKFSNIIEPMNTTKLVPSQMEEYGFWALYYKSCAQVESIGESQGVYDLKEKGCREACGKQNLDYFSTDCEKDLLVCYCKQ